MQSGKGKDPPAEIPRIQNPEDIGKEQRGRRRRRPPAEEGQQGHRGQQDRQFHQRSTIACVPDSHRSALTEEGWVCWDETLALEPSDTVGANSFASSTLRRLSGRTYRTYLTLPANENAARVLSSLLRQLENNDFVVSVPTETHL